MVAKKKVPKKAAKPAPVEEKEEKAEPLVVQKNIDLSSFGYPIPKGWDAQKNKIVVLKDQGDDAQKHLAVIVTDMFQKSIHLSLGEPDFFTAMRNQLNLSSGWIKNLLTSIKIYDDMGLPPEAYKQLSTSHTFQMFRAFKHGAITKSGAQKLIPCATPGSDKYMVREDFKKKIDDIIGKEAGDTGKVLSTYALKPSTGEAQELINSCLATLGKHPLYQNFSQSQVLENALIEFAANHAGDEGKASLSTFRAAYNLLGAVTPEGIAAVLIKTGDINVEKDSKKIIDDHIVKSVFVVFAKGDYSQQTILTNTKAKAAKIANASVENVREFDLIVDPTILPTVTRAPKPEKAPEPVEAEEAQESEKPAPKKATAKRAKKIIKSDMEKAAEPAPVEAEEAPETPETPKAAAPTPAAVDDLMPPSEKGVKDMLRENLTALGNAHVMEKSEFASKYNELKGKGKSEEDTMKDLLEWTRALGNEKKVKVL